MSVRLRFFVGEALSSLRNNLATTVAATMTVLIVMFWLGVFLALGSYMYSKIEEVRKDVKVRVFIAEDASPGQIASIRTQLAANPAVERAVYISKADAYAKLKKDLGPNSEILEQVPGNFLPREFSVTMNTPDQAKAVAQSMQGRPGVEKGEDGVKYGGQTVDRLLRNTAIIEGVIGGLILLLAVAAILLIANTIRLSIFARRREIEVMKLVGATNWFVRFPFVLEGMICGLLGAVLSVGLLKIVYDLLLDDWLASSQFSQGDNVQSISFVLLAGVLLLAGTGLGALGSGLTMRRFLRV